MHPFRIVLYVAALALVTVSSRAGVRTDLEYGQAGGESLRLDASIPDGPGPFAAVILVHGGGWTAGDKSGGPRKGYMAPMHGALEHAGFAWFSINYRLAPKHRWPACFDDLQTAIRWVKAHAAEFKGDPQRIVLVGHSAGGQLVTLTATRSNADTRVQAVVGFAPVTDFEQDLAARGGKLGVGLQHLLDKPEKVTPDVLAQLRAMSPVNRVRAGQPPVLLLHGDADKSVALAQSISYQRKLKSVGVPCDLVTLPGAPHGLLTWEKSDPGYAAAMIAWVNRALGAGKTP